MFADQKALLTIGQCFLPLMQSSSYNSPRPRESATLQIKRLQFHLIGLVVLNAAFGLNANASTHDDPLGREPVETNHGPRRAFHHGGYNIVASSSQDLEHRVSALVRELQGKKHKVATSRDGTSTVIIDQTTRQIFRIHEASDTVSNNATVEVLAQLFPKNARILYATSEEFEAIGNWAKALEYFKRNSLVGYKSDLIDPNEPREPLAKNNRYNSTCAFYESMLGRNVEALKYYERAIALAPTYSINYSNRAQLYKKMGKLDLAAKDSAKAKELRKNDPDSDVSMRRGRERHRGGQRGHYVSYAPNNYEYELQNLSNELKALEKAPMNLAKANLYLQRARVQKQMGHYKESLSDYQAIAKYEQHNSNLVKERTLAQELLRTGAPPYGDIKSIGDAKYYGGEPVKETSIATLTSKKGDTRVYFAIAEGLSKAHKLKECAAEVDKLLKIAPDSQGYITAKIAVSESLNDSNNVVKYCSLLIDKLTTGDASVDLAYARRLYDFRAKANYALAHFDKAVADYSTLLKLDPKSPEAYRGRADCYTKLNKFDLAKADLDMAKKFDSPGQ